MLRRASRLLFADDPRPLPQRLTHEAKRLVIAAAVVGAIVVALVVAVVVTAIAYVT